MIENVRVEDVLTHDQLVCVIDTRSAIPKKFFGLVADLRIALHPEDPDSLSIAGEKLFCGPLGER